MGVGWGGEVGQEASAGDCFLTRGQRGWMAVVTPLAKLWNVVAFCNNCRHHCVSRVCHLTGSATWPSSVCDSSLSLQARQAAVAAARVSHLHEPLWPVACQHFQVTALRDLKRGGWPSSLTTTHQGVVVLPLTTKAGGPLQYTLGALRYTPSPPAPRFTRTSPDHPAGLPAAPPLCHAIAPRTAAAAHPCCPPYGSNRACLLNWRDSTAQQAVQSAGASAV